MTAVSLRRRTVGTMVSLAIIVGAIALGSYVFR